MSSQFAVQSALNKRRIDLNSVFSKVFKPGWVGMCLCVVCFTVASVALAAIASLWQEKSTLQHLESGHEHATYAIGEQSTLMLSPNSKVNVVSFADRTELYVVNGSVNVRINEVQPIHVYAGTQSVQAGHAQLFVQYLTPRQAHIQVEWGQVAARQAIY